MRRLARVFIARYVHFRLVAVRQLVQRSVCDTRVEVEERNLVPSFARCAQKLTLRGNKSPERATKERRLTDIAACVTLITAPVPRAIRVAIILRSIGLVKLSLHALWHLSSKCKVALRRTICVDRRGRGGAVVMSSIGIVFA